MSNPGSHPAGRGEFYRRILNGGLVLLAVFILLVGGSFTFENWLGSRTSPKAEIILAALIIVGFGLAKSPVGGAIKKWSYKIWIIGGLLILAVQAVPVPIQMDPQDVSPFPFSEGLFTFLTLAVFILPCIVLVYAAMLIQIGADHFHRWRDVDPKVGVTEGRPLSGWAAAVPFTLSVVMLGMLFYDLYWIAIWDSTTDSLGSAWLYGPVVSAAFTGTLLAGILPWKVKVTGFLYAILIPVLMVAIFRLGETVNFRQLTADRSSQICQALTAYHERTGHYPQALGQLIPLYLIAIPQPVIMMSQTDWCYQAGTDFYRLGYLDSNDWSSPIRFGRLLAGEGQSSLKIDVCQTAIDAYRARTPNWDNALLEYGQPTPTPDIRESMPPAK